MRIELLDKLSQKTTFTIDEAKQATSANDNVLRVILVRLERTGWIERIEKGKYMIIPLGRKKREYTINEFVIGSILIDPCIISYWSALNFHGLTEQITNTVFIKTTSRKKQLNLEVLGVQYKIIRVNKNKIFGNEKTWFEEDQVDITNKEKTIIDCLDKPKYSGGIIEVASALKNNKFDYKKLAQYANKIGNTGVIRRLGFILDYFHLPPVLPYINTRNYLLLDPTMPRKGKPDAKWRLIINVDLGELL